MRARAVAALVAFVACHRPTPAQPPAPASESAAEEPAEAPPPEVAPSSELEAMEKALLERDLQLRFDIAASGAVEARLVGELRMKGEWLALRASGTFGGNAVELSLTADGERLTGTSGAAKLDLPQPPELADAVVIGLTRMGILHNLAMLMSARPPDHADGGVREWVVVRDVVAEARVTPNGLSEGARQQAPDVMSFAIVVAGNEAGEATLWWDRATSLPVERHQVVRFTEGEMHVRETYTPVE